MTGLLRIIRFAFQNFWRDIWLSSVTVIIFILAISLVGVLSGVRVVANQAIGVLQAKADVTISFDPAVDQSLIEEIRQKVSALPETTSVEMVSADENLRRFKELHRDDPIIQQGTEAVGDNPFGPSMIIQARTLEEYPAIAKVLEDQSYAEAIASGGQALAENTAAIGKLSTFTKTIERFSLILTLVFSIIAMLVVINTVRIAIHTHREEIGIMKLVGATNDYVRGPFLVESVVIGLLSALVASGLLLIGIAVLSPTFDRLFSGYDVQMAAYFRQHFLAIFWPPLVGAVILSVFSAAIAMGRYLKV